MGYYTSFKISTEGKPYDTAELEAINNLKKEANKLSPEFDEKKLK